MWCGVAAQEEFAGSADGGLDEGFSICWPFCNWLAWEKLAFFQVRNMPCLLQKYLFFLNSDQRLGIYQKLNASSAQSSTVRYRWCAVMVPTTFGPQAFTASTASRVVQCSRTILSYYNRQLISRWLIFGFYAFTKMAGTKKELTLGNFAWRSFNVGRKVDSAFKIVIFLAWSEGHSPCKFSTMPHCSIAVKTG